MSSQPKPDLIRAIAAGDVHALDELYAHHGRAILSYLIGLLHDPALAEEVLQDVMLAVWRGASTFRGDSQVRTWLLSIARLQAFSAMRGRKLISVPLDDMLSSEDERSALDHHFDVEAVRAALNQLPGDQRETLELIFYHELSGSDAAAVLGIAPGTVKSRLNRAKSTLRGLLNRKEVE